MKTTATLFIAIFLLQVNILFAGNDGVERNSRSDINSVQFVSLTPVTPAIADFEEASPSSGFFQLAPTTPKEATFEDSNVDDETTIIGLAPVTPAEADFNDTPDPFTNIGFLAPVTPAFADFDELN
jgi:hypothetical protein